MRKFDDMFEIFDRYDYVEIEPYCIIGNSKDGFVYSVDIEYAVSDKNMNRILFGSNFDLVIFKEWMLDKNEEIYCINYSDGNEEYIFKKHILRIDISKGELLSCGNNLYFGTKK